MIRKSRLGASMALACVGILISSAGATQYTIQHIPVASGGPRDAPMAMNNFAQVVGIPDAAHPTAWMWDQGTITPLGTLGGDSSAARDINDLGQVVGSSGFLPGNTTGHAFYYAGGTMYDLTIIGGLSVAQNWASSINAGSQVAGHAIGNDPFINGKPGLVWNVDPADPVNNTTVASFPTLAHPNAINDGGDFAGNDLGFEQGHVIESGGTQHDLGLIPGATANFPRTWANDISNNRLVVGGGTFLDLTYHAARWDKVGAAYQITDLHAPVNAAFPTAHSSDAEAVNELGQIVGWYAIAAADAAAMWDPTDGFVTLFDHVNDPSGNWQELQNARDINEYGQILVAGRIEVGPASVQIHHAVLTPYGLGQVPPRPRRRRRPHHRRHQHRRTDHDRQRQLPTGQRPRRRTDQL